jgi:pyruvate,water dikinase
MSNGRVVRSLQKIGITDSETFLSQYLSGNQQLAGTLPTRSLQVLAKEAEKNTVLKNLIIALPLDIHSKIQSNFEDFYIKVMAFLSNYGDRTVGELKLETRTMRIEPVIFYKYLKNFLTTSVSETQSSNSLHQIALATLSDKLSNKSSLIRSSTFKKLATLQRAIAHREILRLERTRLFGMYRTVYRALGELFVKNTVLESVEDVFYLTEEEIIQGNTVDFKALVKERKPAFDTYQVIQVDSRVITPYPPTSAIITEENPDYLYGTGCVPGRVQGEIIVITDPTQDLNVAGKIVCAIRTDPGWAALFPTCKAVLIEKGSSLSHSVILLRELGIPTIINIPQLTQRLQTGQSVAIDAMEGKIYLKNEA